MSEHAFSIEKAAWWCIGRKYARASPEWTWGAFAEYAAVSVDRLSLKPPNLSFEQAAAVPLAALTALQAVRTHGQVEAGDKVLIIGASGGVGTLAVQIAKAFDAEVTAIHLGGYRSVSDYRRVLKPSGKLLLLGADSNGHIFGPVGCVLKAVLLSTFVSQNLSNFTV